MKAQCPTCKKEQTFLSYGGYYKFITYCRQCRSCSKKKPKHTKEELTRTCIRCGKQKVYKLIGDKNRADKDGSLCKSCASILHNGMKGRHLSEEQKKAISGKNHYLYGVGRPGKQNGMYGKKTTEETKKKLRIARLKWIETIGGIGPNGKAYNRLGCEYLDRLSKEMGWNIQHALNGGEAQISGYSVDGFDKNKNVIVEYDEPRHYDSFGNLRKDDIERMNRIISEQKCEFYRYNEKTNVLTKYTN
jgi:hypothetical protein